MRVQRRMSARPLRLRDLSAISEIDQMSEKETEALESVASAIESLDSDLSTTNELLAELNKHLDDLFVALMSKK